MSKDKIITNGKVVLHESAGGYLFAEENKKLFVALLEDSEGKYFIPKGHLKTNETPEQSGIREVKEELGLKGNVERIAKVTTIQYSFKKPNDKREHLKTLHIYAYRAYKKVLLNFLKEEGYIGAHWFEIKDALAKLEYEKETLNDAVRLYKNYEVINTYFSKLISLFKKNLGTNLSAIIDSGSVSSGAFKPGWSDIDLLIILKRVDIKSKLKIAAIVKNLKKSLNIDLGLNIISENDFISPEFAEIRFPGKTLQTLVELSSNPERTVYSSKKFSNIYSPTRKHIRIFSLNNICLLSQQARRATANLSTDDKNELKSATAKQIKYAFIILKLGIQYFKGSVYESKKDTLNAASSIFGDFNFSEMQKVLDAVNKWNKLEDKKELLKILEYSDNFIEDFGEYVFSKLK